MGLKEPMPRGCEVRCWRLATLAVGGLGQARLHEVTLEKARRRGNDKAQNDAMLRGLSRILCKRLTS